MPLESTVICLDNSEWMRNGDYVPTRMEAQQDAASLICTARCEDNPESTVGILTMAGNGVELLVSPTDEIPKLLGAFSRVRIQGSLDFAASVQIAQLALKHRRNKNGGQRIIVFVGSPIDTDAKTLSKIGTQLKKNNVAVDVVSMGELEINQEKLESFVNAANSNDNCHLVTVPPGVLPSDALLASPIVQGVGGAVAGGGRGGNFAEYGGFNPNDDPEMAMALLMSTEEARAAAEARAKRGVEEGKSTEPVSTPARAPVTMVDEDAMLAQALALSMQEFTESQTQSRQTEAPTSAPSHADTAAPEIDQSEEDDDDDPALRAALAMSMDVEFAHTHTHTEAPSEPPAQAQAQAQEQSSSSQQFYDADFVTALLGSVEGLDMNDPMVQAALAQVTGQPQPKRPRNENGEKKDDDSKDT